MKFLLCDYSYKYKRTLQYNKQIELEAKMVSFAGFDMPMSYVELVTYNNAVNVDVPAGMYFIQVSDGVSTAAVKVIVKYVCFNYALFHYGRHSAQQDAFFCASQYDFIFIFQA